MTKKMAVKNKESKSDNNHFWPKDNRVKNRQWSRATKMTVRLISTLFGIALLLLVTKQIAKIWKDVWPVKVVMLAGDGKHVSEKEIIGILSNEKMGGMLSINLDDLHKKLLNNRWIKTATIRKQWPDTLVFEILEYKPLARIDENILLESGLLVENMKSVFETNLLKIKVKKSKIEHDLNYLELVSKVLAIKNKLEIHNLELEVFEIDEINNWHIQLKARFVLNLGRQEQQQRIDKFFTVFAAIENKSQLENVDLRYRNGLAVKYRQIPSISNHKSGS